MFKAARSHVFPWFLGPVGLLGLCPAAFAQGLPWTPSPLTMSWPTDPRSFTPVAKPPAWPPAPKTYSRAVTTDHEVAMDAVGEETTGCGPADPPVVELEAPPSHGSVCLRHGDYVIRQTYGFADQCLGKKSSGVFIIYLPHQGYTGADALRYTVRFSTGPVTATINLTILPDPAGSRAVLPADSGAPDHDAATQPPGPISACIALVS